MERRPGLVNRKPTRHGFAMAKDEQRAERLAAALRANLRRRKAPDRVLEERRALSPNSDEHGAIKPTPEADDA